MRVVAYRHAAYDTPWWAFPSSRSGRFHRATIDIAQYLCLHPLGPAAEILRHDVGPTGDPDSVILNLWAAEVDIDDLVRIRFDDCPGYGISPGDLVSDDYGAMQDLADSLRTDGIPGVICPSAALPGTENLVLFGVRLLHPYLWLPFSPDEVPTGHLTNGARPAAEVRPLVRWMGAPHRGLEQWKTTGTFDALDDPVASHW